MMVLSCAALANPARLQQSSMPPVTVTSSSQVSFRSDGHPFVPEVVKAVDSLYLDFKAVDNLVAHNTARVLKAFQNARVGSHVDK